MEKLESITGCLSYSIVLLLCGIAFSRWKHPGWLVLGLWALCSLLACTATGFLTWNAFSATGAVSSPEHFLYHFVSYDVLLTDFLPVVAVGLLVFWRSAPISRVSPA